MGSIEFAVSRALEEWKASNGQLGDSLEKRLKTLETMLSQRSYSVEYTAAFLDAIQDAKRLRPIRNIVAHQPLALRVFDPDSPTPLLEGIHDSKKSGQSLSLDDIEKLAAEAELTASRLHRGMANFRLQNTLPKGAP